MAAAMIIAALAVGCPHLSSSSSLCVTEQSSMQDRQPPKSGEVIASTIGMNLVYIPAGEFRMGGSGSAAQLAARYDGNEAYFTNEYPQHRVRISRGFWMSQTEVTQGQYQAVMGSEPWLEKTYVQRADYNPAVFVSWDDAVAFCERLGRKEGQTYQLPTEAQWEYACRAGTTTQYNFGEDESTSEEYAWFKGNTLDIGEAYAQPVGLLKPNAFGLYDMHGNVWEWCRDYYDPQYYRKLGEPAIDPENSQPAPCRVLRGGCWYYPRNSADPPIAAAARHPAAATAASGSG